MTSKDLASIITEFCDYVEEEKNGSMRVTSSTSRSLDKYLNNSNQDGEDDLKESCDSYVEKLKKKYLKKQEGGDGGTSMDLIRGVLSCSPSSMLNDSERNHYTRAMEELRVLLDLSKKKLSESKKENDNILQSTANQTNMVPNKLILHPANSISPVTDHRLEDVTDETLTQSTTLPTLSTTGTTSQQTTFSRSLHQHNNSKKKKPKKIVRISLDEQVESDTSSKSVGGILRNSTRNSTPLSGKLDEADVRAIHNELMTIHRKLNEKSEDLADARAELDEREQLLAGREEELYKREQLATINHDRIIATQDMLKKLTLVEDDVRHKLNVMRENHAEEMYVTRQNLEEKCKELKRIKANYEALKRQNDDLRTDDKLLREENERVRNQNVKLRKRLENLQRKIEFDAQRKPHNSASTNSTQPSKTDNKSTEEKNQQLSNSTRNSNYNEKKLAMRSVTALSVSLEWICEVHVKPTANHQQQNVVSLYTSEEYLTDRCLKLLPLLVDVFRHVPLNSTSLTRQQLVFLKFVYWSLQHLEDVNQTILSSTSRRIGEELIRNMSAANRSSSMSDSHEQQQQQQHKVYYKHSNCEVRLISCFIILHTLNQVDVLAKVFDQLRQDLKTEANRALFVGYNATHHILLPFLTHKSHKCLVNNVIDVMLQMSMESSIMDEFLLQCSTEKWFRAISILLHSSNLESDVSTFEKLVVILQKLSKIKSNRKYFDSFSLSQTVQDKYRVCPQDQQFLSINLRSIISNLNLTRQSTSSSS